MSFNTSQNYEPRKARTGKRWFRWLLWVGGAICVLGIAVSLIPTLDGPNMRRAANEAVAVGNPTLQMQYVAAHPLRGFSCKLADLKQQLLRTANTTSMNSWSRTLI